jgi:hypothetical protein
MRIAFDELVPEGEEVACVGQAPSLHDARAMQHALEAAHLDFAVEVDSHATFQLATHEHPRAVFYVAAGDAARACEALRRGRGVAEAAQPSP